MRDGASGSGFRAATALRSNNSEPSTTVHHRSDSEAAHSTSLTDLPEDILLILLNRLSNPLRPLCAISLVHCCKTMRMHRLRQATKTLKGEHCRAQALGKKGGSSVERMGSESCARLSWNKKDLTSTDVKVLARLGRSMPLLQELDLRFNSIGDDGLAALGAASAKGWLPELNSLGLCNNRITTSGAIRLSQDVLASPAAFTALESLSLNHNDIAADGMASMALAIGQGGVPMLLTLFLTGNPADDGVVQQALLMPSAARLAAAKLAGGNGWNYLGGHSVNTLRCAPNPFGQAALNLARADHTNW